MVQVGANDGDKYDPLRDHIASSGWRGVLVEPVPYVFERLAARYAGHPRIATEPVAISAVPGRLPFYCLREPEPGEVEGLPRFYDALGSFRRDVLLSHADHIPDIGDRIRKIEVEAVTFDELCRRHGLDQVDLLHIDTEGYDLQILETVDLERYQPRLLIFEVAHLDDAERQRAADLLAAAGYLWFEEALDWWCVDARPRDITQRMLVRAVRWILDGQEPGRALGFPGRLPDPLGALARRGRGALRVLREGDLAPAASRTSIVTAEAADRAIIDRVAPLTMTGPERQLALLDMVAHVERAGIPGAFVECGVWRGGSVLAMALKLRQLGAPPRHLYLYDTFEGMTEPTELDTSPFHPPALTEWARARHEGDRAYPTLFREDDALLSDEAIVQQLVDIGYPRSHIHVVVGPVEQTLPATLPERIALLRLDTDWYESTKHELEHLYPLLSRGGGLLIDDYGHWEGCARAVEEYFGNDPMGPLLQRVDYTMRMGVRP